MSLVKRQGCSAQRRQAFEAPINFLSNKPDNGDYKNPLESNKSGPSKTPARPEALTGPEALAGPEAPVRSPQDLSFTF